MADVKFSVIIPCYNEENAIVQTLESIVLALKDSERFELIVVDDASTDKTLQILESVRSKYQSLIICKHGWNRGYGASLKTGIRRSNASKIVITDADGTYPNERIPELLKQLEDADMVVGARIADEGVDYPLIRKIPKYFLKKYSSWLAGQDIPDMNSGLRAFRKDLAEKFLTILPDGFSFTTTITLAMLTNYYRVEYLPITYSKRIGKSKIRPVADTLKFIQLIVRTGMYFAPLRVFFPILLVLGFAFLASFIYDVYYLKNLTDKTLILLMFTLNTIFFALLADMLDKRGGR